MEAVILIGIAAIVVIAAVIAAISRPGDGGTGRRGLAPNARVYSDGVYRARAHAGSSNSRSRVGS